METPTPASVTTEESFELTISNGAATLLRKLMNYYHVDSTKEVLSIAMSLLDAAKEGEITVKKPDGSSVRLDIPKPKNAEEGKN